MNEQKTATRMVPPLFLAFFIAAKLVGGTYLSLWSWWWVLAPVIPVLGLLIHHFSN